MRVLWDARRDRPEPRRVPAGRVRPHGPPAVLLAVVHVIIVSRPRAARSVLGRTIEGEHVVSALSAHAVAAHVADGHGG